MLVMNELTQAAALLRSSPNHRVLERVPPVDKWRLPAPEGDCVRAAIVDCETTGLSANDEVIELAILPFEYEKATGRVVKVLANEARVGLCEPSIPIQPEATKIHGITDAMVSGKLITDEMIAPCLNGVQLIIAHHAGFDRPHVEAKWPIFESLPWACSIADMDWAAEGIGSAKLDYILWKQGWFFEGHRAGDDAEATLFALSLTLPVSSKPALAALLERARRPQYMLRAVDTSFEQRDLLRGHGYAWDPGDADRPKAWVLTTTDPESETAWLESCAAWTPRSSFTLRAIPARVRYSSRALGGG